MSPREIIERLNGKVGDPDVPPAELWEERLKSYERWDGGKWVPVTPPEPP